MYKSVSTASFVKYTFFYLLGTYNKCLKILELDSLCDQHQLFLPFFSPDINGSTIVCFSSSFSRSFHQLTPIMSASTTVTRMCCNWRTDVSVGSVWLRRSNNSIALCDRGHRHNVLRQCHTVFSFFSFFALQNPSGLNRRTVFILRSNYTQLESPD